jgi:phosphoribosylglycinamide formyltransferase-1
VACSGVDRHRAGGATGHFVSEECDGGPIIAQRAVAIREDDTPETLQKRIMEEAEWKILPLSCEKVCAELIADRK